MKIILNKSIKNNKYNIGKLEILILGDIYYDENKLIKKIVTNYLYINNLLEIFKNIEGIFNIIITNKKSGSTIIINDKLGLKPIFIYKYYKNIIISDSLELLIKSIKNIKINEKSLLEILSLGYLLNNKTLIKNISRLNPGVISYINGNKIKNTKYFTLNKIKNTKIDYKKIYKTFYKGVNIRLKNSKKQIYSDLTGGFDTRLILGTLIKQKQKNNIKFVTEKIKKDDIEISSLISKNLGLNHLVIEKTIKNKKTIQEINTKNKKIRESNKFNGLCGGEILGNSIIKEWFIYDNIESIINKPYNKYSSIIKGKKYIKMGIKNFIKNILRSHINTVQGEGWKNPCTFFDNKNLSPFTDSNFIKLVYSTNRYSLKNYKLYKKIYNEYFPELLNIKYTENIERDNKYELKNNNIFIKNYILSKKELIKIKKINEILFDKNKNIIGKILNKKSCYRKPLEMKYILLFIEKIKRNGGNII